MREPVTMCACACTAAWVCAYMYVSLERSGDVTALVEGMRRADGAEAAAVMGGSMGGGCGAGGLAWGETEPAWAQGGGAEADHCGDGSGGG